MKKIVLDNCTIIGDASDMFAQLEGVESIEFRNVDTSKITNMSSMFANCSSLESLDLSRFDTVNVTSMRAMFYGCTNLKSLEVSSFNTEKVTDMNAMFASCSGLSNLNLAGFNTVNVEDMEAMFSDCTTLKNLDLGSFNTKNVTKMARMFENCMGLELVDLSSFDTSNADSMERMFWNCHSLVSLDMKKFNLALGVEIRNMLSGCFSLKKIVGPMEMYTIIDLPGIYTTSESIETSELTSEFCEVQLTRKSGNPENVSTGTYGESGGIKWTYNVETDTLTLTGKESGNGWYKLNGRLTDMFPKVKSIIVEDCTISGDASHFFIGLNELESIEFKNFDVSEVTNMYMMFCECNKLKSLDLSGFDTSNVTDMDSMFSSCSSLTDLDISSFDTSKVTTMRYTFMDCGALNSLDLSGFNMTNVRNTYLMLNGTDSLKEIYTPKEIGSENINLPKRFYTPDLQIISEISDENKNMLLTVDKPISGKLGDNGGITWNYDWDTDTLTLTGKDSGTWKEEGYNPDSTIDTMFPNVKKIIVDDCTFIGDISYLFANLEEVETIEFKKVDTSQVTNMASMFMYCKKLMDLDLSKFDTSNVTSMSIMFFGCSSLKDLDLSNFDTSNVTDISMMFADCVNLVSLDISSFDTTKVANLPKEFDASSLVFANNNNLLKILTPKKIGEEQSIFLLGEFTTPDGKVTSVITSDLCNIQLTRSVMQGKFGDNNGFKWTYNISTETLTLTGEDSGVWRVEEIRYGMTWDAGMLNEKFPSVKKIVLDDCTFIGDISYLFEGLENVEVIEFNNVDTSQVTNMEWMFASCKNVKDLDLSDFDTGKVIDMYSMFLGCSGLKTLNISNVNTAQVTNMGSMFEGCSSLVSLDVGGFDTANVVDMQWMFHVCSKLKDLEVGNFDTQKVQNMSGLFYDCNNLTQLNLSSFDMSKLRENCAENMFRACRKLKTIQTPKVIPEGMEIALADVYLDEAGNKHSALSSAVCATTLTQEPNPFSDVQESGWQYAYVKFALNNNLMKGKDTDAEGNIVFDPDKEMTRAEFVQTLYNKEGKPAVTYTDKFPDVAEGKWYTNAILWAAENNIVAGKGNGNFDVSGNITRQEMATILYKYANYKQYNTVGRSNLDNYTDASSVSSWAVENMKWALYYGVMKGKGDRLAPLENATRAECATMLCNFMSYYEGY